MKSFSIVVAMDEKNGIGKNGDLAWRLSADLKHFKEITTKTSDSSKQNAVVMGRKTWESLPEKFRPLPNRLNVILTRNSDALPNSPGVKVLSEIDAVVKEIERMPDIENVFVIGGAQIYSQFIKHPSCYSIYVTYVKGNFNCDAFFPPITFAFKLIEESLWHKEGVLEYRFCQYQKIIE